MRGEARPKRMEPDRGDVDFSAEGAQHLGLAAVLPFRKPGQEIAPMLVRTEALREIGGFAALRGALIDDCTLARRIKDAGGHLWLGLSHDVRAVRPYEGLAEIWNMVARTAFTQLHYSLALLLVCTLLMGVSFIVPVIGLVNGSGAVKVLALVGLLAMAASYAPVLRFYRQRWGWLLTLPLAASLYLAMTWTSALRYWRGERSRWKNRIYERGV